MAKVKAEVVNAVFNGKGSGESVELSEKTAKKYEKLGYLRNVSKAKKPAPKKTTSKKPAASKAKSAAKPKTKDKK